jgi:hypothetical protein
VTKWIGMAALFYFLGDRLGRNLLKRELNVLGAIALAFVFYALLALVPIFGWLVGTVVAWVAVGLMIATRFGTGRPWFPPAAAVSPLPASTTSAPAQ